MSKIFIAGFLCAAIISNVFAQEEKSELSAEELKEVRTVSRALLAVRSQQRSAAIAESEEIRADVEKLKGLLYEAQYKLEVPVLDLNGAPGVKLQTHGQVEPESENVGLVDGILKKIRGWTEDEGLQVPANRAEKIHEARSLLANRRQTIEKQLPSVWEVWKEKDPAKEQVAQKLQALEDELVDMEKKSPKERKEALASLLKRLEPPVDRTEPDPTISTITKHIKK